MRIGFKRKKAVLDTGYQIINNLQLVQERQSFRDNELKLIRSTITNRRKEISKAKGLTPREQQLILDTLSMVERHAVDVAFLMNRERMQELGAPKQHRSSHIHGVDMGL